MRLILGILALVTAAWGQSEEKTVLAHATVIDGTGAVPLRDYSVEVQGGRIAAVYASGSRPARDGARVEDLSGKWIIPGLIDAHVHIADEHGDAARFKELLGRLLLQGVTGLRDMAGDARTLAYLAREARLDSPGWPDIYFSALMAGPTFFFEDARVAGASRGLLTGSAPWMRAVDETTDLRMAIAEAKGTGATGVKMYANLPPATVKAIAAEAHRQGLLVWSHATIFPAKPSDAIEAGVDTVSHTAYLAWEAAEQVPADYRQRAQADFTGIRPDDPRIAGLLARMKERGTVLDATVRVFQQQAERAPDAVGKGIVPWMFAVTRAAHDAGVLVAAGTDSGGPASPKEPGAGAAVVEEMALLVKACGFTPLEAIRAATQISAMAVGEAADRGRIARGMAADLVVLGADPVADIGNVRKVIEVWKDGRVWRGSN